MTLESISDLSSSSSWIFSSLFFNCFLRWLFLLTSAYDSLDKKNCFIFRLFWWFILYEIKVDEGLVVASETIFFENSQFLVIALLRWNKGEESWTSIGWSFLNSLSRLSGIPAENCLLNVSTCRPNSCDLSSSVFSSSSRDLFFWLTAFNPLFRMEIMVSFCRISFSFLRSSYKTIVKTTIWTNLYLLQNIDSLFLRSVSFPC